MKILFHLGHPAHYHLFKNSIRHLQNDGHTTFILIKKKDVLEELLQTDGFVYKNLLPRGRSNNRLGIIWGVLKADVRMYLFCLKWRPTVLVGTSIAISHVGKLLQIPVLNVNEDDANAVPFYARLSYPWSDIILSPNSCNNGKWENKTIHYPGFHELAYLHPSIFKPDIQIIENLIPLNNPYFVLRTSALGAHHDKGISGINNEIALKLVEILQPIGNIYITSERELIAPLEDLRINIPVHQIHHLLAFATLVISDSQTMSAESAVLGTPFIRFNDFVGRLGYLQELEEKYKMGTGINSSDPDKLFRIIEKLVESDVKKELESSVAKLIEDTIKVHEFITWIILQMTDFYRQRTLPDPNFEKFK